MSDDEHEDCSTLVEGIVKDIFSFNSERRKRVLEYYFFDHSTLSTPILYTRGLPNIHYVYTVWQLVNEREPIIKNVVFDGQIAVVQLTQIISPRLLPSFLSIHIPTITTFYFKETNPDSGLLKIETQEDHWTIEGLLQSLPFIAFWYWLFRILIGKILAMMGDLFDAAIEQADKMTLRGQALQQMGQDLAIDNMEKIEDYRMDLQEQYIRGIRRWREETFTLDQI